MIERTTFGESEVSELSPKPPPIPVTAPVVRIQISEWHQSRPESRAVLERVKRLPWIAILYCFGLLAFSLSIHVTVTHRWNVGEWVLSQLGVMVSRGTSWAYYVHKRAPLKEKDLMDFPVSVIQYPVSVKIRTPRGLAGTDVGVVVFMDDLLHFEGTRISFDLLRSMALLGVPDSIRSRSRSKNKKRRGVTLPWELGSHRGQIVVMPFEKVPGLGHEFADAFWQALYQWESTASVTHQTLCQPPTRQDRRFRWWR